MQLTMNNFSCGIYNMTCITVKEDDKPSKTNLQVAHMNETNENIPILMGYPGI